MGQSYSVVDLGTLGGTSSFATGLNNSGQVVGYGTNAGGTLLPFIYSGGTMSPIGSTSGQAMGINDSGLVVGFYFGAGGGADLPFFSSGGGAPTNLPGTGRALSVNASGDILVRSALGGTTSAVYSGGSFGPTMPLLGSSINNAGVVAGNFVSGGRPHAAIYSGGVLTDLTLSGGIPGPSSYGIAINNTGQVALTSQATTMFSSYRFAGGTSMSIGMLTAPGTPGAGTPDVQAMAINSAGWIVGHADVPNDVVPFSGHAFLFDGTTMVDLNNLISPGSGWRLTGATGINDAGWIVGTGVIGGNSHAFLLMPIPEPGTWLCLVSVATVLLVWRARRRPGPA